MQPSGGALGPGTSVTVALSAEAEISKGVMSVTGAEME
jgi:hypothetical protein